MLGDPGKPSMGPAKYGREGRYPEMRAPFGNAWDLVGRAPYGYSARRSLTEPVPLPRIKLSETNIALTDLPNVELYNIYHHVEKLIADYKQSWQP